ncbi:hypothetical protein K501DRAFT_274482 [Backusella circina FSU 941]|nr:hypothetical protein K501DRAFT_274482 [Backusella circina FSU 941]
MCKKENNLDQQHGSYWIHYTLQRLKLNELAVYKTFVLNNYDVIRKQLKSNLTSKGSTSKQQIPSTGFTIVEEVRSIAVQLFRIMRSDMGDEVKNTITDKITNVITEYSDFAHILSFATELMVLNFASQGEYQIENSEREKLPLPAIPPNIEDTNQDEVYKNFASLFLKEASLLLRLNLQPEKDSISKEVSGVPEISDKELAILISIRSFNIEKLKFSRADYGIETTSVTVPISLKIFNNYINLYNAHNPENKILVLFESDEVDIPGLPKAVKATSEQVKDKKAAFERQSIQEDSTRSIPVLAIENKGTGIGSRVKSKTVFASE